MDQLMGRKGLEGMRSRRRRVGGLQTVKKKLII